MSVLARTTTPSAPTPAITAVTTAVLQRACFCGKHSGNGGECEECRRKREGTLQRAAVQPCPVPAVPCIVDDVLRSPGQPLDAGTRAFMEPRFGHDFSGVRVHTDGRAMQSAGAVNALAYTVGRDVVFGTGQYTPGTADGRRLLAHELTHVLQQRHTAPTLRPWSVNRPGDAAEQEADAVAERVLAGSAAGTPHVAPQSPLQRQVVNSVLTDFQPNPKAAKACLIHIHGEEQTALAVAQEMRKRRCVNFVHLDTKKRHVDFTFTVAGVTFAGQADPNRIFTPAGRAGREAILETHPTSEMKKAVKPADVRAAAEAVLQEFADTKFSPQVAACRKGATAALPVVALHNNEGLNPTKFKDSADKSRDPNPSFAKGQSRNDFFFTTQAQDFDALKGTRNVVLQENPVQPKNDDGSLSVGLADQRYINVEKEGRNAAAPISLGGGFQGHQVTYLENYAMAADALDLLGVPDAPCAATDKVLSSDNPTADKLEDVAGKKTAPPTPAAPTDAPPLVRDATPTEPPKGCQVFADQASLDTRKAAWAKTLGKMPLLEIINWIIGGPTAPPAAATAEVQAQQQCMIDAMRAAGKAQSLTIPKGNIVKSERRDFGSQRGIWERKFQFTGAPFDRISDFARKKCGSLIAATDVQWNPKDENHQLCWGKKQPKKNTTVPVLTAEERQREILMASSAPGVSRHHAGTDFDFGSTDADLEPEAWTGTGNFADAYRWLAPNAATYGFMQPFNTKGGYGKGYMAERWHWSYYPIAQALLEFAKAHDVDIDTDLRRHWTDAKGAAKEQFKFVIDHWHDYMFNVETKGRF